jgi:diguanylate cyclase (GGDEF)-like protein
VRPSASVHRHFVILVALGSLAFSLVVGLISFAVEYRSEYARARLLIDQLVATVQASAAVSAFAGNQPIAKEVVDGLLANPLVAEVRIVSSNGFSYSRSRTPNAMASGEVTVYPLFSPMARQEKIGELSIRQDDNLLNQRAVRAAFRYSAILILQIPVFALLSLFAFSRLISRPLNRVAGSLVKITPGGNQRIEMPEGQEFNEIGLLVKSSNAFLDAAEQAILDERRLQAEVDAMQANYRRIFDTSSVGVMILDSDGLLLTGNAPLLEHIAPKPVVQAAKRRENFIDALFMSPKQVWSMIHEAVGQGQSVAADLQLRDSDDRARWVHCVLSATLTPEGSIDLIEGVVYDVTARRELEAQALRAAEMDTLTGLLNRRGMENVLDHALTHAADAGKEVVVMLLDLDGFKAVNDTHGHAAGDTVLKVIGERLTSRVRRASDLIARLGGDEFTVIIYDAGADSAAIEQIAHDLIRIIGEPISISKDVCVKVGSSIGIAQFPANGTTREELLSAADEAMYEVKRRGKNNYALASGREPA